MTLYCATRNPGKLREFQLAAQKFGIELLALPTLRAIPPCPETGSTFEENAVLKAIYYSRDAPALLFADDSGLEVDALDGAPGALSARYAGEAATDAQNNARLIAELRGVDSRRARFVCVIALADQGDLIRTFRGTVEGEILHAPRGALGFGYDPLFFYPPFGRSFGEINAEEKLAVGHRGKALARLFEHLEAPDAAAG